MTRNSTPWEVGGESFPPQLRLRTTTDFRRVIRQRTSVSDPLLVVYGRRNPAGPTRLGVVVPRKLGSAVIRNRWKRLLREFFRRRRAGLPKGIDVVVMPRRGAMPDWHTVSASLPELLRQLANRLDKA
jgi:ribonuclease P protein component